MTAVLRASIFEAAVLRASIFEAAGPVPAGEHPSEPDVGEGLAPSRGTDASIAPAPSPPSLPLPPAIEAAGPRAGRGGGL